MAYGIPTFKESIADLERVTSEKAPSVLPQTPDLSPPELIVEKPPETLQNKLGLLSVRGIANLPRRFWRDYLGYGLDKHR